MVTFYVELNGEAAGTITLLEDGAIVGQFDSGSDWPTFVGEVAGEQLDNGYTAGRWESAVGIWTWGLSPL